MVTAATAAPPFFACQQLRDKRCCWPFENTFVLWKHCRFGPLKFDFPPSLRHVVELYAVLVLASGLSWKWKFSSARFQLRYRWQYGLEVYLWLERRLPCWGSLEVCQYMEKLRCNVRNYTLRGLAGLYAVFFHVYLWDDFWQTFQCPMNVWICFSWSVKQVLVGKKIVISKSVSFYLVKDLLLEWHVSPMCTPGNGIPKG